MKHGELNDNKYLMCDLAKQNLVVYPSTNPYIIMKQWTVKHEIRCAELGMGQVLKCQQNKQITIFVVSWQSANLDTKHKLKLNKSVYKCVIHTIYIYINTHTLSA